MRKRILIITGSHDLTADYLIEKYGANLFFRLNTDRFSNYSLSVTDAGFAIENAETVISDETCSSILYRKPLPENLSSVIDDKYQNFAHVEAFSLIDGIVESFDGPCLSKPSTMRRANNKILQLHLARRFGFELPPSVITNCNERIETLGDEIKIVKPLAIGVINDESGKEYVQTNIYDPHINNNLLRYAPAYFQSYIEKDYELRITMIGDSCHAIRINSADKIDWRKPNNSVSYNAVEIDNDLKLRCLKFMRHLNMDFGCFDFIVKDEKYFFLEMNANGQWAWIDEVAGFSISKSLVSYLK